MKRLRLLYRIVFYSTNSNVFDEETFKITVMPGNTTAFEKFCAAHPEDSFVCVTQKPGMFMPENAIFLPQNAETDDVVSAILELKPDLAIAMTFWIEPYDWLPVSDALVAEKLKASGVRTICQSVECAEGISGYGYGNRHPYRRCDPWDHRLGDPCKI